MIYDAKKLMIKMQTAGSVKYSCEVVDVDTIKFIDIHSLVLPGTVYSALVEFTGFDGEQITSDITVLGMSGTCIDALLEEVTACYIDALTKAITDQLPD